MARTILITGATGFLGSALCAGLSQSHRIIGLYRRPVPQSLKAAAPSVLWFKGDVSNARDMLDVFKYGHKKGYSIDYVIHFAAFTGFGKRWKKEYEKTNVTGTKNIIEAASGAGVSRILFAGSIASLEPPGPGKVLTEKSKPEGKVAYARSKAIGEKLFFKNAHRVPAVTLRLGGVFTDWCELPPLFSVIKIWHKPFLGRIIPGKGLAGFPYIHRKDVVAQVKQIIKKDDVLDRYEVLLGAPSGAVCQKELFPIIRRACSPNFSISPLYVPSNIARLMLHSKFLANTILRRNTYERAWMLDYADRPLVVNAEYTVQRLGWKPDSGLYILNRLPLLMANFKCDPNFWMVRNINRNDQNYHFYPDTA